jgi:hypothetical protein
MNFKAWIAWITAVCMVFVTGSALAGFKTGQQVVIGSGFANGDLGYVHNTPDANQYIGCYLYAYPNQLSGGCYARDVNGTYGSCYTSNANMISVISSLKSDGYLLFYWDANNNCTFIEQETDSMRAPKTP